jgi:hypothetical protein
MGAVMVAAVAEGAAVAAVAAVAGRWVGSDDPGDMAAASVALAAAAAAGSVDAKASPC